MIPRKRQIGFMLGIVLVMMLACSVPVPTPVVVTATPPEALPVESESATITDTPELVVSPPAPEPAPALLKVAYIKAGDVWVWAEGSSPAQLTFSGNAISPRLSADGQIVAFSRGGELGVVNSDGSGERTLADLAFMASYATTPGDSVVVHDILWQAQTHLVVFNTQEISEGSGYQMPLYDFKVADADAGITLTTSPGEGGVPYLSPNHEVFAFGQPEKVVFSFPSSGTRLDALTYSMVSTYSEWFYVPELTWLPDSSAVRLVVPAHDPLGVPGELSTFWNVPTSGSPTALATFLANPAFAGSPYVSPDGQAVVYLIDNGPNTEIHTITSGGVDTLMMSFPLNTVRLSGWHPDSVRFMFSQPDLVHANLGSGGSSQVLGDTPKVQKVHWIDDTRYLFMNDNELRISELGGASTVIDSGVIEFDPVMVSE